MEASAVYLSVHRNAVNAATRDFRFVPVSADELPGIDVHISLLSPVRDIASADEYVLGRHGIILLKGRARAVFLPEVAVEQGWTRERTLSELSRKSGLDRDAWRDGARFQVFESVVLGEA
jgi:AmmeMemoRadiSam system protein A